MDHNPDIINVLIHDRTVDLLASAHSSCSRRKVAVSIWRKLTGAALVRLGEAILGEPRPTTAPVSLSGASLCR